LILLTSDDGFESEGLWSAAEALLPLGDLLVVAPDRQWSGAGRSMPPHVSGEYRAMDRELRGRLVRAYVVDASPALCVVHALLELAPRRPALVVAGINHGANLSTEVTVSGTVGAALEAATFGLPSLAVSLDMDAAYHLTNHGGAEVAAAQAFTLNFARLLLQRELPFDADLLNLNLPREATPATPWRLTRLSRRRYYLPVTPDRSTGTGRPGYRPLDDAAAAEPDSDIYALHVDGVVSVTPLSLDLTARVDLAALEAALRTEM